MNYQSSVGTNTKRWEHNLQDNIRTILEVKNYAYGLNTKETKSGKDHWVSVIKKRNIFINVQILIMPTAIYYYLTYVFTYIT